MPRLSIASTATAVPMGAQAYEQHVISRAPAALAAVAPAEDWQVRHVVVRSLRSGLPGTRRLPMGRLSRASRERQKGCRAGGLRSHRPRPPHDARSCRRRPARSSRCTTSSPGATPTSLPPVAAAAAELRRAAAVICVSEFTASEAVDLLGLDSPVVVPNGVEQRFFDASPLAVRGARGPRRDDALRARGGRGLGAQEPRRARRRLAARPRRTTRHDPRARRAAPPAAHRALRVPCPGCGWWGGCPTPCCRACMPPRPSSSCPRSSRGSVCRPSRAWLPGCRSSPPTGRRCRRSSATAGCSSSRWASLWRRGSSTC